MNLKILKMKNKKFFIQGVLFLKGHEKHLGVVESVGLILKTEARIYNYTFAGLLEFGENEYGEGVLYDNMGISIVSKLEMQQDYVYFKKKYTDRRVSILNKLKRNGDLWEGESQDELGNRGALRCFIKEVPLNFFSPEDFLSVFEEKLNY